MNIHYLADADLDPPYFLFQATDGDQQALDEGGGPGGVAGNVDIHRENLIQAPRTGTSTRSTIAAHRDASGRPSGTSIPSAAITRSSGS